MYPEQKSASVAYLEPQQLTPLQKLGKALFVVVKAVWFTIRQIISAIFSLMMPILLMIIGLGIIFTYHYCPVNL